MFKLTPIIFLIASVGIFFFFIDPQYKEVKEMLSEKNKNQITLSDADKLDKRMREIQSQFNSFSDEEKELLRKILPDQVDNVRLIQEIDNLAAKDGLIVKDIGVVGTSATDEPNTSTGSNRNQNLINTNANSRFGTITLSFSITAPYPVFKSFMNELEESLRLVDIKKFSVKTGESDFYDFSVTLNTYWSR
jgi:Tfp pilus assembly protein PilO